MKITDSQNRYGLMTKLLHWSMAVLFFVQFYLVYRREYFPKDAPEKISYILLHKSLGITVFFLGLWFILNRVLQTRPPYPTNMQAWEKKLARLTQIFLFASMLLMPLAGYLMSMSKGRIVKWFDIALPALGQHETVGKFFYLVHVYLSYAIIAFVVLHIVGALKHQLIYKDDVLKKMTFGG